MQVMIGLAKQVASAVARRARRKRVFRQETHDMRRGIDYTNVADAIETLDGPAAR